MEITKILGSNISLLRKKFNLSQTEFVNKIYEKTGEKKNITTVSSWENGYTSPDASLIPVIADILNVSIAQLYDGLSPEPLEIPNTKGTAKYEKSLTELKELYKKSKDSGFEGACKQLEAAIMELTEAYKEIKSLETKLEFAKELLGDAFKNKEKPKRKS